MEKKLATEMTQGQKNRFESLTERIFKETTGTFKGSDEGVEGIDFGPVDEGIEFGEDVSRVMEIVSGGVTYRVIVSAGRE